MTRIGIVGDIGSGKTFVANNFGYPVFNADYEVSKLYKRDRNIYLKLKKKLPKYIFTFPIDKNEITKAILASRNNFKEIINIVHKEIRKKLNLFLKNNKSKKFVVLDIPLLFETGGEKYVDVSIVVTASNATQQSRVVLERRVPLEVFNAIKGQQMPDRDKLKKADYIISTDCDFEKTKAEVKEVALKIKLINPKAWNTFFNQ